MREIIFSSLLLFSSAIYSQINFYEKLFSQNAVHLNVGISNDRELISKSILFDNGKIVKLEEASYFVGNDNYLKIIEVAKEREPKFLELLKIISEEKNLFSIKQEELNIKLKLKKEDEGDGVLVCTSDGATYYINITLNQKLYSLQAYVPEDDCGRSREKLDLFLKFFKLIEDTWSITNTPKGRSLKE